jgi:hypothetical protein
MEKVSRRRFMQSSAVLTFLASVQPQHLFASTKKTGGWDVGRQVNPQIDNMRVVCGVNPAMISKNPLSWQPEDQNAVVNTAEVDRTLDSMAVSLAQKSSPTESWATVFQKPNGKQWGELKVAIKVNCNSKNNARIGIISKVCRELNALGVPFKNMIIYDGRSNAWPTYSPFLNKGLPDGVIVSEGNKALGGMVKVALPWENSKKFNCTKGMVDGTVDILINIANNKGCDEAFGQTTLTLKNHAGTFEPMPLHFGGGIDYLMAFNRSKEIMGTTTPRQQLCIVDSLWGMRKGPFGVPEERMDRIVMGTFSPAVDYLTAKKIREPMLGVSHANVDKFLTGFGYSSNNIHELVMATL